MAFSRRGLKTGTTSSRQSAPHGPSASALKPAARARRPGEPGGERASPSAGSCCQLRFATLRVNPHEGGKLRRAASVRRLDEGTRRNRARVAHRGRRAGRASELVMTDSTFTPRMSLPAACFGRGRSVWRRAEELFVQVFQRHATVVAHRHVDDRPVYLSWHSPLQPTQPGFFLPALGGFLTYYLRPDFRTGPPNPAESRFDRALFGPHPGRAHDRVHVRELGGVHAVASPEPRPGPAGRSRAPLRVEASPGPPARSHSRTMGAISWCDGSTWTRPLRCGTSSGRSFSKRCGGTSSRAGRNEFSGVAPTSSTLRRRTTSVASPTGVRRSMRRWRAAATPEIEWLSECGYLSFARLSTDTAPFRGVLRRQLQSNE